MHPQTLILFLLALSISDTFASEGVVFDYLKKTEDWTEYCSNVN